MEIQWIPCQENDVMFLSPETIHNLNIKSKTLIFHFGALKGKFRITSDEKLDEKTIGLPSTMRAAYTLPVGLPYDVYLDGENLHVGPVIGFFVREGYLSKTRRNKWRLYCQKYSQIRGLVYFCTISGIDFNTKTIRGYYFDPNGEKSEQLKPGVFPYPGVVYRRSRMSTKVLRELKTHVGDRFFNAHIFDKWEMWTVLNKKGFANVPYTCRFEGLNSLNMMIACWKTIYLKPEIGRFSNGIIKIEQTLEGYSIKRKSGAEHKVRTLSQVLQFVEKYKRKKKYIVQQAVPLKFQGQPVDFRVILQKDGSQKWVCSGIIAKFGMEGHVHTNRTTGLSLGYDALEMIFGLNHEEALKKQDEIIRICTQACQHLEDAYGRYGDVGIDVSVDENLKVWILEINKSHQHDIARLLVEADPEIFNRVVSRPLEYAKALSGFK